MGRTVLIVDDHEEFRTSARAVLEAEGFEVVGEVATGGGVVEAVTRLRPGVVLLDIRLPDVDGFAVAALLAGLASPPEVVLVSSRDAVVWGARLRDSPARGFLPKSDLSGAALRRLLA
ncbi:two-component system, NarL family, nitrate/nitrite response regulator NarL/two-component system, NarL family, response regulator EvgA [Asanoa hainanensis]|uniref:Two-component system, NarL family, nitrate/nitrite response regulator NarL/two-component system, NarL family, response regulator EvgA n=1 Tax=Asanoa hainanensis TaxID=560556 RepID=A0A239PA43_9ACTN|nr:response regulator transcription factor [Asanoa hainanensis]SNT63940.1 two-component system, NarL family, nitrate/nitrite response regulator NarL/two-component system, NarL family, response regulator EvgA [Asanoa hainanensis]